MARVHRGVPTASGVDNGQQTSTTTGDSTPRSIWDFVPQWQQTEQSPQEKVADPPSVDETEYVAEVIPSISKVSADEWNKCVKGSDDFNPFLLWEFLNALEESGSVSRNTGWYPQHIVIRSADKAIHGCCPLYLKTHSYGEYVFDHSWANAASYMGHHYYPKLQSCVPFTPVPGPRLLVKPGPIAAEITVVLTKALKALADELKVSSLHITFNSEADWNTLQQQDFLPRMGLQYHWHNQDYTTFDDFLMELRQSKRKSIRQERKCLEKAGLKAQRLRGDDIRPLHWDRFYEFYIDTCGRKWGDPYLRKDFFHQLGDALGDKVVLVMAEDDSGHPVAGALNMVGADALYGRNWGKRYSLDVNHLHFELCYYQAIEAAIEMGLSRVEAGAQGEHKIQRGYLPQPTFSSHYIRIPRLRAMLDTALEQERQGMQTAIDQLTAAASPFKKHRQ